MRRSEEGSLPEAFLTSPAENMTTRFQNSERREVSLLVKADIDEYIEKAFG
jgi:hypothetical protein